MKIYVAAKWEDKDRAQEVQRLLRDAGHTITYDWTVNEEECGAQVENDIDGVRGADAFVGIFEQDLKYAGALMEFGAALAMNIPVYILGSAPITRHMFFKHSNVHLGITQLLKEV